VSDDGRIEIPCRDAGGRPRTVTVSLIEGQMCITFTGPSAFLDWREADQLQHAIAEKRTQMPGAPA
jgi:hypothetical protein